MSESSEALEGHPAGDGPSAVREVAREAVKLDTFGGTVHVEWDPDAAATPLGHLAFFAETAYAHSSGCGSLPPHVAASGQPRRVLVNILVKPEASA